MPSYWQKDIYLHVKFRCWRRRGCLHVVISHLLSGRSVLLVPGGIGEMFENSGSGTEVLKVCGRKGFVRIAIQTGAQIVPCYTFGNWELFEVLLLIFMLWLWGVYGGFYAEGYALHLENTGCSTSNVLGEMGTTYTEESTPTHCYWKVWWWAMSRLFSNFLSGQFSVHMTVTHP